ASIAARRRYIQPNPPPWVGWLVFDVDLGPGRDGTATLFAWEEANLPAPNLAVATRLDDGSLGGCHLAWALREPVARGAQARPAPLRYLAAIERAMVHQLGADPGYTGLIAKNPLHPSWHAVSFTA